MMRYLSMIVAALVSLATALHAAIDTLSDLSHLATYSARVQVTRIVTLTSGEQQVSARVLEQMTGKPLGQTITIWNGDVTTSLPTNTEGRSRRVFQPGEYLVFLDRETDKGLVPCFGSWIGFAEIRDGVVHWRAKRLPLAEVLRDIPRTGIGPK